MSKRKRPVVRWWIRYRCRTIMGNWVAHERTFAIEDDAQRRVNEMRYCAESYRSVRGPVRLVESEGEK